MIRNCEGIKEKLLQAEENHICKRRSHLGTANCYIRLKHSVCDVFVYSVNQRVVIEHLRMLNSVLGPENTSVNKIEKFSAFLNGVYIQVGHITNKYETDAGREECYEEKLSKVKESRGL